MSTDHPLRFEPGQRIICEGDSMTSRRQGATLDTWAYLRLMNWHRTWPEHFAEALLCWWPELALKVHTAAVGGSSCLRIADRLDTMVLPRDPDWVLMSTGANDLRLGIEPEKFAETFEAYTCRLHDECGARTVFLSAWCEAPHAPEKMKLERVRPYYDRLAELDARHPHVHWLDLTERLADKARALADQWEHHTMFSGPDAHYNEVGSRVIAGEVLRAFGLIAGP